MSLLYKKCAKLEYVRLMNLKLYNHSGYVSQKHLNEDQLLQSYLESQFFFNSFEDNPDD